MFFVSFVQKCIHNIIVPDVGTKKNSNNINGKRLLLFALGDIFIEASDCIING